MLLFLKYISRTRGGVRTTVHMFNKTAKLLNGVVFTSMLWTLTDADRWFRFPFLIPTNGQIFKTKNFDSYFRKIKMLVFSLINFKIQRRSKRELWVMGLFTLKGKKKEEKNVKSCKCKLIHNSKLFEVAFLGNNVSWKGGKFWQNWATCKNLLCA